MVQTPTVSILTTTYNRVELSSTYVPKLLDRVGNISAELLIWDNGSNDGSYDWAYTYGKADCRVSNVVGSNKNLGMEAFNTLCTDARGKYVIKVDDDIEVPEGFGERLVRAYETIQNPRIMLLSWDMPWNDGTFAKRSGLSLYKPPRGENHQLPNGDRALISYELDKWLINGACRLSPREEFIRMGGHPQGILYGVDMHVSARAHAKGYCGGYLTSNDLLVHHGLNDTPAYRKMKDQELERVGSPRHV